MQDSLLNGRSSVLGAALWMLGVSFVLHALLWWVPVAGPFIGPLAGGYIGGRRAGTAGRALLAAVLPALASALLILGVGAVAAGFTGAPLIGGAAALIAGAGLLIALAHGGALMAAALIGGLQRQWEV